MTRWITVAICVAASLLVAAEARGAGLDQRWYRVEIRFQGNLHSQRSPNCGDSRCRPIDARTATIWEAETTKPVFIGRRRDGGLHFDSRLEGAVEIHEASELQGGFTSFQGGFCDPVQFEWHLARSVALDGSVRTRSSLDAMRVRLRAENGDDPESWPVLERNPSSYCHEVVDCDPDYPYVCAPPGPDDSPEPRPIDTVQTQEGERYMECCPRDNVGSQDPSGGEAPYAPAGTQRFLGPDHARERVAKLYTFKGPRPAKWGRSFRREKRLRHNLDYDIGPEGPIHEQGDAVDEWDYRARLSFRACPRRGTTHRGC